MSDDIAGEVERYQFWVEDLIRQRNDALGRVDDLAGDHAIRDAEEETRYPEAVPDAADSPMVEKMRWSLGLREDQTPMGPEEPGWMYLLPDGSRTNSCDEARAGWLLHCEAVGERMASVVGGMRQVIMETLEDAAGDPGAANGEPGPYEVELLNALGMLDAIITTTVANPQSTPPELLPKMRRKPRPVMEVLEQEIEDAGPESFPGSDYPPDDSP